jgi:hypothetical protein
MKRYITLFLVFCGLLSADILTPTCYRDNDKNVVICSDKKLGKLVWQDEAQTFTGTLEQAIEYCKLVNLAGYKDWRLPTVYELTAIADKSKFNPAINYSFDYVLDSGYWTLTKSASDPSKVWVVYFMGGLDGLSFVSGINSVRCVRND